MGFTFVAMNKIDLFSNKDSEQIQKKGLSLGDVENQLDRFKQGFPPLKISAPATVSNGIMKLSDETQASYILQYEQSALDVVKFVPASGAASRMFKSLFAFLDNKSVYENSNQDSEIIKRFFTGLKNFSFYAELDQKIIETERISLDEAINAEKYDLIISLLLKKEGLNYGNLPKGLLSFHSYDDHVRTPAQEHLSEGKAYAIKNGKLNIHFTVSPTHFEIFQNHIEDSIASETSIEINVSYSEQSQSTDTLASTIDFSPFRDDEGNLLFRPAGHGALLQNLNSLSEDLIFIKNIDNVVSESLREDEVKYKKALAGVLIEHQQRAFKLLRAKENGTDIKVEGARLLSAMGMRGDFSEAEIVELLNRPIRVCGMVKNEGEPGGGPFWIKGEGYESLQIVESAQVDQSNKDQRALFNSGTHFNPVDIVCGIKDNKGEKFNLLDFRDDETGFISEKSHNGQKLLAMELPGLWNGSMAKWNTIFVEVPLKTFNPVKTVTDLLKPAHR